MCPDEMSGTPHLWIKRKGRNLSDELLTEGQLWQAERRLWLDRRKGLEEILAPTCMMALSFGVFDRLGALEAFDRGPRWASIIFAQQLLARPAHDLVVLGYVALAAGPGTLSYQCCCTSTYRNLDQQWKIVQHQQTPLVDAI